MNEKILIVDDEERIRILLNAYLKIEGLNIFEAENGMEAIEIIKKQPIDLIILDVMMPVMDGWTTCREIRKISNVPVIMLTAKAEDEDKLLGFQLGVDNYETKPFSPKILTAKVKALLKRTYEMENLGIKNNYDGLIVDEGAHKVLINEDEINLSPKEFELLVYFIKNKGISLSRDRILDNIWGIDFYGDSRTVDTHIKRLREKLGGKAYLISTIRGSGYKFEVKR